MDWIRVNLSGDSQLTDLPQEHDAYPVRQVANYRKVMGNEDVGQIPFGLQVAQQVQNLRLYGADISKPFHRDSNLVCLRTVYELLKNKCNF